MSFIGLVIFNEELPQKIKGVITGGFEDQTNQRVTFAFVLYKKSQFLVPVIRIVAGFWYVTHCNLIYRHQTTRRHTTEDSSRPHIGRPYVKVSFTYGYNSQQYGGPYYRYIY